MESSRRTKPFNTLKTRTRQQKHEYAVYYIFAKEFGWTPEQVDKLPRQLVIYFLQNIEREKRELEKIARRTRRG